MSNYTEVNRYFAGRLDLMPRADERVTKFEKTTEGNIAVVYTGREKTRVMRLELKAGEWVVACDFTMPTPKGLVPAQSRISGDPEFHFTEEPFTAKVPLTHHQKALRYYNLLGW
jgi:hypothetical protein